MELYHTIGYLISHQEKKEENNIEEEENDEIIKYSIPATVSYSKNNIIHEITLTLPTKEIFLINSEQLSHLYLDNNCLFIPLPTSPYLEITLMQFCDTFMIELGKSHLLYQRRKLTPRQFYGKSSRHTIFSIFPRQELAFQFYDEQIEKESLKIFSFEAPLTGRRKFLVSDMNTFHHKYRCNINRHVYEIIREGYPCRLYFDIEYSKETNPDVNGEFVVELWISLVLWKLDELYGIVIPSRNIIHLDSSTEKKFSRHIIFLLLQKGVISKPKLSVVQSCLPSTSEYIEYLFHDNLEVGQFVLLVMLECLCDHESLPSEVPFLLPRQFQQQHVKRSYSDLWLFNSDRSSRVFAIDLGVYTRNRAFRCFSSTKYGKLAILGVQHPSQATLLRIPPQIEPVTADVSYNLLNGKLEEDCWYFPSYEWSFRSSTTDEALQRKIRCTEKIISDSITQFNYFVRPFNSNVPVSQMPSEILERTFVIPVTVTSSDHTKLSSSYSLLPLLKDLISSHEDQNLSSTLEFCLGCCTTPVPMINRLCPFHGESQLLLSLSRRNIKPEGCSSSSTLLSSTFLTHESFKSEFVKIEELLCSKRLSSTGHCNSPFLIFDDYVLYIAGLNANSQYGPLRITQYSLKSILTTLPTTTTPTPNEGVNIPPVYTITYQITGTKYCHRIGRHHKSNHIMFEANINQGYIIQKCWDPDCRGYKSPPFYLPYNSLPSMYEIQEIITDIIITNSLELIN